MLSIVKGKPRKFVSEKRFKENLSTQLSNSAQTLESLRKIGVTRDEALRLEYYYCTNSIKKAQELAKLLEAVGFTASLGEWLPSNKTITVSGMSTPVRMDSRVLMEWTDAMCRMGQVHDCEFDGWSVDPEA